MGSGKLTDADLNAFLSTGRSQAEAARFFGVSEPAIYQRLRRQNNRTSRVLALEHGGTVVEQKLDGAQRLARVQAVIDAELTWALTEAHREGTDRGQLVDVILRISGEIRMQLGLQLQISKALIDAKLIREFQAIVLDVIRAEAPETARRIIDKLKAARAMRQSIDLPGIGGSDGAVV